MHPWPLALPEPAPLTVPLTAPLPASYWQAVAVGRWPQRYWLPTSEPTSDSLDGVAIHALATAGPRTTIPGLPEAFTPFACDGQQVFVVTTEGRIRYLDLEVDQWLDVAANWDDLVAQLQWRPPHLDAPYSAQQLAHTLLVADAQNLPALFEELRAQADWEAYTQWLQYLQRQSATAATAGEEAAFARSFLPLSADQKQRLSH